MQVDPERLPHWTRVAFAARCARRVQPLFAQAWPDAAVERVEAVERAIALAEQSGAEQRTCDGLNDAVIDAATMAAGRALIPHHYPVPLKHDEPGPIDSDAALVASFAAKVAEKAAAAGAAAPSDSGPLAREAFQFALHATNAAGRPGLVEVIEADFEAALGSVPRRPWWRFW